MDFYLFLDSTAALLPYFRESARLGFRFAGTPAELFSKLRILGVEAERAMHATTNGVNTHKGAIFLLGILVAAGGRLLREGQLITEEMLFPLRLKLLPPS
jgi:triphosphoribosyl-dephospho-CoA synthetase